MPATLIVETPLGPYRITSSVAGVTGIAPLAEDEVSEIPASSGDARARRHLVDAARALDAYFAGRRRDFADLALAPRGTPFQLRVWAALRAIPFGATRSYAALAQQIGRTGAARAVGGANGSNPLSIVVPCHRVIGGDGRLVGYAGGLPRKRWLLAHEGVALPPAPRDGARRATG